MQYLEASRDWNYIPIPFTLSYPDLTTSLDAMSDYLAVKAVPTFIQQGAFTPTLSSGWTWTDLRNINYFIVNCNDPEVSLMSEKTTRYCKILQSLLLF